ncbi:MAG: GNAT family N-acetyltransferase [Planctomycetes bacterium]|nr:GNAT family N-acetyltransferase [Planctomycetota bacterium]
MELIAIDRTGEPEEPLALDAFARGACFATARNYARAGFAPPWIGYLAVEEGAVVGTCTFRAPPDDGRVEIGYHTSPEHEGKGVASRMAKLLVALAHEADPTLTLFARTTESDNASTKVLKRAGFAPTGPKPDAEDGVAWEWERAPVPERTASSRRAPSAPAEVDVRRIEPDVGDRDSEDEVDEDAWIDECRAEVHEYLEQQPTTFGRLAEGPAWHVSPYVSVWAIESVKLPGKIGWWAIAGDVPTDYASGQGLATPRAAIAHFARVWREAAACMERGETHPEFDVGGPGDAAELAPLLRSRAEILESWAREDSLWDE